jgi:hypothetical protein
VVVMNYRGCPLSRGGPVGGRRSTASIMDGSVVDPIRGDVRVNRRHGNHVDDQSAACKLIA